MVIFILLKECHVSFIVVSALVFVQYHELPKENDSQRLSWPILKTVIGDMSCCVLV